MLIFIIIVALILFYIIYKKVLKPYHTDYDTFLFFCGGPGSGKTLHSVNEAIKRLRSNRAKVNKHNRRAKMFNSIIDFLHIEGKWIFNKEIHKIDEWERPLLYSNIPVVVSRKERACVLTEEHLCCVRRVNERSVLFIDELGSFASQWSYRNVNLQERGSVVDFFRFVRHFTKGGYVVANDQAVSSVAKAIRSRICLVYNLFGCRSMFHLFSWTNCRHSYATIDDSGSVSISDKQAEDSAERLYCWLIPRRYDTYCHSDMYKGCLVQNNFTYGSKSLKSMYFLSLPEEEVVSKAKIVDFKHIEK